MCTDHSRSQEKNLEPYVSGCCIIAHVTTAGVAPPLFRWLGQEMGVVGHGLNIVLFIVYNNIKYQR